MLQIETTRIGDVVTMTLTGRIDSINAHQWQTEIDRIVEAGHVDQLIFRMRGVNYLSAAGLRILRQLEDETHIIRIAEPSDRVVEVMSITGLDVVYRLFATMSQALHDTLPTDDL